MGKRTPFYELHVAAQARIVDFADWEMPLHYGSQLEEHHQVRQRAGMFDVSHMGILDLQGESVQADLRLLLANTVDRLTLPGRALYTCLLNHRGGILDDLIVYKMTDNFYRLVVNAGTREKDFAWIKAHLSDKTSLIERTDLAILALQGPLAISLISENLSNKIFNKIKELNPFYFDTSSGSLVARTGYTGEEGVEMIFPATDAATLWNQMLGAGFKPCGLAARDTLRLEAGFNLYGADMDETVTPYESNLGWTVALTPDGRQFIGRQALEEQKANGSFQHLIGLLLEGPGMMRPHQKIFSASGNDAIGEVTSGGYSPTLEKSIAFARLRNLTEAAYLVEIRGKKVPARRVKLPFVREGKKLIEV